jgi:hypothetical protein
MRERDVKVMEMFKSGLTMREIALAVGVCHQRVAQILARNGPNVVGGVAARSGAKREAQEQTRDAACHVKFGHGYAEQRVFLVKNSEALRAGIPPKRTPLGAFNQQRRNARLRGIPWRLKLAEWWGIWVASGKWESRGAKRGNFVMSRCGDKGAYEVSNVFIQRTELNIREGYQHRA